MQNITFKLFAHISLITYIAVLIWLLYALRKMIRNQATQLIYATLYFWLLLATKDIAYLFDNNWYDPQVTNVLMSIDLWPTPIITILLLYALQPKWLNMWKIAIIVTPFFIFTLLNIINKGDAFIFLVNQIYGFFFATIFGAIILILTFKCDVYLNANYSNKMQIDIRWIRYFVITSYAICTQWFFFSIESTWLGDALYYLSTTGLTALLFYFTLNHREVIFPNYMSISMIFGLADKDNNESESTLTMHQYAEIELKLEEAINRDKIYLNPQLSLTDLANNIGTNRTYLSRYINHYKATPFINFINAFRCEEAQQLLKAGDNSLTMIEVSERCGFASYSTFRRVFKNRYGYAPSKCK